MKKRFIAAIILCLTIIFPNAAFAAPDNTYTLDVNGASMTIEMPPGWDVITRDMSASQAAMNKYGLSANEFQQSLESQSIYIVAINPETSNEIVVVLMENESSMQLFNLSTSSDQALDFMVEELINDTSPSDLSLVDWKKVGAYKYWYYEYGTPVHSVQYTTILNGQYVKVSLQNYQTGTLGADEFNSLTDTMKSISFSNVTVSKMDTVQSLLQDSVNVTALLVTLAIGAAVAILLLLLLFRNKNKTLTVTQQEYNKINRIGGLLILMAIRIFVGIILGFPMIRMMVPGTYFFCFLILVVLYIVTLILLFIKNRYFIAVYILVTIYAVILPATFNEYISLVSTAIVESLFMLYLFKSKRVAIVYKTKKISIENPQIQSNAASLRTTAANLEELKKVNPIAYKRNVVGIAAGFRDFAGMIAAHPELDNSLAFATSTEDLDKIAAAYGYPGFDEMFRFSEEKLNNKNESQE